MNSCRGPIQRQTCSETWPDNTAYGERRQSREGIRKLSIRPSDLNFGVIAFVLLTAAADGTHVGLQHVGPLSRRCHGAHLSGVVRRGDLYGPEAPARAVLRLSRFRGRGPTLYPVACAPQAWSSGVFFALLQASLGIEQDPFEKVIRFRNSKLPPFLDSIVLRGLQAGSGNVDLSVHRHHDAKVSFKVLEARGDIQVFEG
jgi:hypothetical protein